MPPIKPAANAGLTLYVSPDSLHGDWARLVLAEKDVDTAVIKVITPGKVDEDFLILNPAQSLPTLADREGVISSARVIVEYLDERYPHPPLMPQEPAGCDGPRGPAVPWWPRRRATPAPPRPSRTRPTTPKLMRPPVARKPPPILCPVAAVLPSACP